jgi:hypothetical protein
VRAGCVVYSDLPYSVFEILGCGHPTHDGHKVLENALLCLWFELPPLTCLSLVDLSGSLCQVLARFFIFTLAIIQ